MSQQECQGCREYVELSRRQFMASGGAAMVAASFPAWLPRVVYADSECSSRDIVVSIFLRGAADGMTLCVPWAENEYYVRRPTLAVPRPDSNDPNRATDLDSFFGLPPAMTPLLDAYSNGDLLIVHACGSTDPSRSHFDAQRFMEVGKPADPNLFTGWLGRHLMSVVPLNPTAVLRAVGIGYGLQRTLAGAPKALPIPDLDLFGLTGSAATVAARRAVIDEMYDLVADPVRAAAETTQVTIDLLNTINFAGYQPGGGAVYPADGFGLSLKSTAALIKADVGVEAVHIDVAGWDTHSNQGVIGGTMATLMASLAGGLAAFHRDMWSGNGRNVTVVVMSEFGRRLAENGSGGSDHGHGNAMMVLGNHVAGGRVLRNWPGLQPGQLFEGIDLDVTIDFRDILAEVVQQRLGNSDLAFVFPGFTPTPRGVFAPCVPVTPGDLNCDGVVNGADIQAFEHALIDPPGYAAAHPGCNPLNGDFDQSGQLDSADAPAMAARVLTP